MLPRQKLSRRGQYRDGDHRRRNSRALAVERLEPRTLLSFGDISTVAGDNNFGYTGNGGPATSAELNNPSGVAFDSAGDLFIADTDNNVIREVVESSTTASALHVSVGDIITVAGNGTAGYKGDGEAATKAELDNPTGVAVDSAGDIFIADQGNDVIREVVKSSGDITTAAGDGTAGYSGDGAAATKAELDEPTGVAVDSAGDIFIADEYNQEIREVVKSSGDIVTVAGDRAAAYIGGYSGDGGPATKAELNYPTGVALDSAGDIFIADEFNNRIREVVESQSAASALHVSVGDIVTVAGDGTSGYTGDGGPATKAELDNPTGVALDAAGDLFIADEGNDVVREASESSGHIVTVAGDGFPGYGGDGGPATQAELLGPYAAASDTAGDLFIADAGNNVVREVVATAAATNTGVTSSENPSPFAYALTFTATVSDTSNPGTTPTGTVQFTIDGNDYGGPVALVDGQASIGDGTLAAGAHSILAIYTPGSSAFVTSTSSLTQTVNPGPTTLNLDAYDGPAVDPPPFPFTTSVTAVYGEAVSITANLTPPYGGSPTGTITFFEGGTVLGIFSLPFETSFVTLTTSSLPLGTNSITASYSGDPDFASSTAVQAATVTVTKASTQMVLSSEQGKKVKGAYEITIQLGIAPVAPGAGVPTGTVTLELPAQKRKKPQVLAKGSLNGGKVTLLDKKGRKGNNLVDILYSGDTDFEACALDAKITIVTV
jgi:Bacterial Ig-like domain (group 3)/NHL repeat